MKSGYWNYASCIFFSTYTLVTSFIITKPGNFSNSTLTVSRTNETEWTWDNRTNGFIKMRVNPNSYTFYLVGMAFLGGFIGGFVLRCVYALVISHLSTLESSRSEHAGGIFNLSFIGDDSRPPVNDNPPDYDTVVSDGVADSEEASRNRFLNWLRRKIGAAKSRSQSNEELPPSYETAIQNNTAEMHNSGLSRISEELVNSCFTYRSLHRPRV
ncbi:uncharacterized protein LOC118185278 isoform X1 [Stegodyphus dumicola]|uniref:uncharacterized protein LOC118185278 isoform X1 n=1 Tax=Stegodyphus dumicola TaxID=202533 RepID=UPI0015AD0668|nr:uncharacterized protein LOC118185278 isoform X1 [Stegodyphus dumicola]